LVEPRLTLMSERLRKMNRVLKVQQQLREMAEMKLLSLQRRASELTAEQEVIIHTLNDDAALHGLFVGAKAKRLQALARQSLQVDAAKAIQQEIAFDKSLQVKRSEKLVASLKEESRHEKERRDFLSLLDSISTKTRASFP
jgi:hypothetical protein